MSIPLAIEFDFFTLDPLAQSIILMLMGWAILGVFAVIGDHFVRKIRISDDD